MGSVRVKCLFEEHNMRTMQCVSQLQSVTKLVPCCVVFYIYKWQKWNKKQVLYGWCRLSSISKVSHLSSSYPSLLVSSVSFAIVLMLSLRRDSLLSQYPSQSWNINGSPGRKELAKSTLVTQAWLRWSPHNIRAIMANIKLPTKPLRMVIFWLKVRSSYRGLSSQADPARENWTWNYPYFS